MSQANPTRILLVSGMSGAGKSTALDMLEDLGWEVVDNLPLRLLSGLLSIASPEGASDARPLAIGIDSRTRGFDAGAIVERIEAMRRQDGLVSTLFLDCAGAELERRYSETRRRHPLALDRPAVDGIARERELLAPLRYRADHIVDTTSFSSQALKVVIRERFGEAGTTAPALSVMSFGFARGLPRNADLVFDMRFLRNPHWDDLLRPLTGLDERVADYIREDVAYETIVGDIERLLSKLIDRYRAEGKSYVTLAFGCTGGRHRSVHVAERVARQLRGEGFSLTVTHRDLNRRPDDSTEGRQASVGQDPAMTLEQE